MPTAEQLVGWAQSQVGVAESPAGSNRQPYAACAGHANGQPWCASFVVCGAKTVGQPLPGYGAYTPTLAQSFKDAGQWVAHTDLAPGDFTFWYESSMGRIAHVELVETPYPNGDPSSTVDLAGNTSSNNAGDQRNGGIVARKRRSLRGSPKFYCVGAGRPNYSTSGEDDMADYAAQIQRIEDMVASVHHGNFLPGGDLSWFAGHRVAVVKGSDGRWFVTDGIVRRHIADPAEADVLVWLGLIVPQVHDVDDALLARIPEA